VIWSAGDAIESLLDGLEQHPEPADLATKFTRLAIAPRLWPSAGADLGALFEHRCRRGLERGLAYQSLLERHFERLQDDIGPFLRATRKHVVQWQRTVCRPGSDKLCEFLR
jgi:hypothetical protein